MARTISKHHTPAEDAQSIVIIVQGQRGGTGKTTLIKLLDEWYRSHGISPMLYDADHENRKRAGSLTRCNPDRVTPLDILDGHDIDNCVEKAASTPGNIVLVDMPAASMQAIQPWFDVMTKKAIDAYAIRMLAAAAILPDRSAIEGVIHWADMLEDRCDYLIGLGAWDRDYRLPRGTGDDPSHVDPATIATAAPGLYHVYADYYQSVGGTRFIAVAHPHHILIPVLDRAVAQELHNLSLMPSAVMNSTGKLGDNIPLTSIANKSRIGGWLERAFARLDSVKEILLPVKRG